MTRLSLSLSAVLAPVFVLGTTSCSTMSQTQARLAEWKEKREERRLARDVALAEKELAEEAATTGKGASSGMEDSIFLDYANPGGSLLTGQPSDVGEVPALPGSELPVVLDLDPAEGAAGGGADGIFLAEGPGGAAPAPVDADLVRAWASSISPLMGASLTEPLITAAMTAQVSPTEAAVAAHAAATDTTPLASAFAGQPTRAHRSGSTSETEHE